MAKGGSKSGSKTLTGILCFIFGFLFAIIVEVALIAGGVYFLMKADIDDVLSLVGVENEDENGNKIIINTNVDEGGVKNITDLITAVRDMFGDGVDNLTIGEVEGLFPVADRFVDSIYSGLAGALSAYDLTEEDLREIIDKEELKATPVSQMGEFITECLNNVEVATVLRVAGINPQENAMFLSIAYGMEAGVIYGEGEEIVLYRDVYTLNSTSAETPEEGEGTEEAQAATAVTDGEGASAYPAEGADGETYYVREADGSRLPQSMEQYLVPRANGTEYWLYYTVDDSGSAIYAEIASLAETEDGEEFTKSGVQYSTYDNRIAEVSGAYYYDAQGELVILSSRTLGDVLESDGGILSAFDDVYITDVIGGNSGADDMLMEIFDGITVGDILDGNVIFNDLLDKVYVPDVLDVMANDAIMMYMGYSIVDVQPAEDVPEGGIATTYTGTAYVYELSADGSQWVREERPCVIITSDIGIVQEVWFTDGAGNRTEQYNGVTITDINAQTANVLYDLKVKDVIEIDESDRLMSKIGEYAIHLPEFVLCLMNSTALPEPSDHEFDKETGKMVSFPAGAMFHSMQTNRNRVVLGIGGNCVLDCVLDGNRGTMDVKIRCELNRFACAKIRNVFQIPTDQSALAMEMQYHYDPSKAISTILQLDWQKSRLFLKKEDLPSLIQIASFQAQNVSRFALSPATANAVSEDNAIVRMEGANDG